DWASVVLLGGHRLEGDRDLGLLGGRSVAGRRLTGRRRRVAPGLRGDPLEGRLRDLLDAVVRVDEPGLLAAVLAVERLDRLVREEHAGALHVAVAVAVAVARDTVAAAPAAADRAAAELLDLVIARVVAAEELGHVLGAGLAGRDDLGVRLCALADGEDARPVPGEAALGRELGLRVGRVAKCGCGAFG